MKHILNNLTEQEKQAILEQHKGGMKVMNENFSKLIKATLGDAKPLVSEQSSGLNADLSPKYTHFADKGVDSPGIQKFMLNPNDTTISNGLLNELRNDPYGKGKIVIIFNGEKFKEPGAFMYKIQTDFKVGKCYKITDYEYNNRILLNTQITITANAGDCKKQVTPKPTPKPEPKVGCKYTLKVPDRSTKYQDTIDGKWDSTLIKNFQQYCSTHGLWYKELSNKSNVKCSSKDIDGKWGCCAQTCYEELKNRPRKKVGPSPTS